MRHVTVRITRNFARNLDSIEEYLRARDDDTSIFSRLLDELFAEIIPALESFPDLGTDFLQRAATSREAASRIRSLRCRLGDDTCIRELIRGQYLLLYARGDERIYLLAIRHHRQLSFDFLDHWSG